MSSPAAPGLTSPQALRSLVLQASSASEDVSSSASNAYGVHGPGMYCLEHFPEFVAQAWSPSGASSSLLSTFLGCIEAMRCSSLEFISLYMVRDILALHME